MGTAGETIRLLADQIRQLESSCRTCEPSAIPLGIGGLGELFPQGLSAGSLVELLSRTAGAGAWTLALVLARCACGERKTLLIADPERCFYPPAATKFGVDLERTIIVRPNNVRDALSALAEALRCSAIGVGIGVFERLHDRDSRRLQLAAEAGGTIGVLLRPASARETPSFAATRLLLEPVPSARGRRRLRVQAIRQRQGAGGPAFGEVNPFVKTHAARVLEIDDATGHVRALSELELAADRPSSARPAG